KSITEISDELRMTKGNISSQVANLEQAGLIEINYENGNKGIRKTIKNKYNRIVIIINENQVDDAAIKNP
ncbi:helix-turn-helix domain-containing protein, partial [Acidianus sp. RZ1]